MRNIRFFTLFVMISLLFSGFPASSELLPVADAQINNNQPGSPVASVVDCVRAGPNLGAFPESSPRFVITCFGTKITTGGYTSRNDPFDANPANAAVLSFGDAKQDGVNDFYDNASHLPEATLEQIGAVYGLAFSPGTNPAMPVGLRYPRIFAAAYTKMQTRFGPAGPGGIYQINRNTGVVSLIANVPAVVPGPSGGIGGDPGDGTQPNFPNSGLEAVYTHPSGGVHSQQGDTIARDLVGKTSLGDIDLDPTGRYLYAVNLNNRLIYRFDTWAGVPQSTMTVLPAPPQYSNPNACNQSGGSGPQDLRPFGLAVTSSNVYLGVVCSAESTQNRQDLAATVLRLDIASNSWQPNATAFSLTTFDAQRGAAAIWQPWRSGTAPAQTFTTPILSDIVFDEQRNMILGFRDRTGDMNSQAPFSLPVRAQGDLLLATPTGTTGTWNAPSAALEHFIDSAGVAPDQEAANGGIDYIPGTHAGAFGGEVISNFLDPYRTESFGVAWWDVSGGTPTAKEELYQGGIGSHMFGKANGLGDVELLCAWRAIGDRVWRDTNGNGIQDAGEPDINGVRLQLFAASDTGFTTPLATVTTGAIADMSGNWRFYVDPYAQYRVRIDPAMFNPGQPLAGLSVTLPNVGNDHFDSDAAANGSIAIPSGGDDEIDVSFDVGLTSQTNIRVVKSGPASVTVGSNITWNVTYTNDGPAAAANVQVVDTLPTGMTYVSATPAPSSVAGQVLTWNLGTLAAGASGSISITAATTASVGSSVTNRVTITTTTAENPPDDNTSTHITQILRPDVWVDKTGPANAAVGSSIAYTLSYGNAGAGVAANVQLVDTLPAGLTFVGASPAPSSVSGQVLTWNLGTLAAGTSNTITINATVTASAANSVTNNASITTTTTGDPPGNNTSTHTTTVPRPNVRVTKTGPATATVGSSFSYTLSYNNNGAAAAANVQIVDTLPAGLTFVSASPAPASVVGQALTWNVGTLAAGGSGSITVNVQSSTGLANGAVVINNVTITTTSTGDPPGDNTDTTSTTMQRADVRITKSSPDAFPVLSGQTISYHLDYANNGPAAAANVVVQDIVPPQMTGVTWTCASGCSGSGSGNNVSVNIGTLAAGASGRITVFGTATTTVAREDFVNVATISTGTPETSTSNNTSSANGSVWTVDLQVIKLAQAQVTAGETFTATLHYANNGPAAATSVVLTDTLPADVSFVSSVPAPSSVAGQTLTWNLGALASGQTGQVELVLQSAATLPHNTTVVNTSGVRSPEPDRDLDNNSSTAQTLIVTEADLEVVKTAPAVVVAGEQIVYTLTYTNAGPSVAWDVVLTDTLPAEITFVSAVPAPTAQNGQELAWNLGDLAPGATGSISIVANTNANQSQATILVTNTVQIDGPTPDPNPGNNTSTTTTEVQTTDLSVVKAAPPFVIAGEPFTTTLEYANAGPAVARNATIRDLLPAGLTIQASVPPPSGPGWRWNLGDLAPGATGRITLTIVTASTAVTGTTYVNTAVVDTPTPDRDGGNDSSTSTSVVRPNADLQVVKSAPAGPIPSGSEIVYTLTYTNAGPSQALDVLIRDTPPTGFVFGSAVPAPTTVSASELRWEIGALDAGDTGVISITGRLYGEGVTTNRTNTAFVSSPTPDPDPGNNTSTVTTPVEKPDLSVTKTDGQTQVNPGDVLTYSLVVRNSGLITATGVVLTDTLPASLTPLDAGWTAVGGHQYTQQLGDIAPNETVTRTMRVRLPNPLPADLRTQIVNNGRVGDDGSTGPDPTPGDNTTTDIDTPQIGRVGDTVWFDADADGRQDTGEGGLAGVTVQLIDPATGQVIAEAVTNASGQYLFEGLRFGQYQVRLGPTTTLAGAYQGYTVTTPAQQTGSISASQSANLAFDFGLFTRNPTAVVLAYFLAEQNANGVLCRWGTLSERDTSHFRVMRATTPSIAEAVVIGTKPSIGSRGGDYSLLDSNAPRSGPLYYWLVEVERNGKEIVYGPISLRVSTKVFAPFLSR